MCSITLIWPTLFDLVSLLRGLTVKLGSGGLNNPGWLPEGLCELRLWIAVHKAALTPAQRVFISAMKRKYPQPTLTHRQSSPWHAAKTEAVAEKCPQAAAQTRQTVPASVRGRTCGQYQSCWPGNRLIPSLHCVNRLFQPSWNRPRAHLTPVIKKKSWG